MSAPANLPGTYVLLLRIDRDVTLPIGRLGCAAFPRGDYVYVGSARGPGGLRARLGRHFRQAVTLVPHWHVDWLRRSAKVVGAWWQESPQSLECQWLRALSAMPAAAIPMPAFGSSDCTQACPAHLLFFGTMDTENNWSRFLEEIHTRLSDLIPGSRLNYCSGPVHQEPGAPEPGHR